MILSSYRYNACTMTHKNFLNLWYFALNRHPTIDSAQWLIVFALVWSYGALGFVPVTLIFCRHIATGTKWSPFARRFFRIIIENHLKSAVLCTLTFHRVFVWRNMAQKRHNRLSSWWCFTNLFHLLKLFLSTLWLGTQTFIYYDTVCSNNGIYFCWFIPASYFTSTDNLDTPTEITQLFSNDRWYRPLSRYRWIYICLRGNSINPQQ